MADDGSDFDTRFGYWDAPAGTATAFGGMDQSDPLRDWAKNLRPDDLANFLQNPQDHAQQMAAAGIPPPDQATMDAMHDHNDSVGTPSRSSRADLQAAQDPLTGPVRTDQSGRIIGNITGPSRSIVMSGSVGERNPPDPNAPKSGGTLSDPLAEKIRKSWQGSGEPPQPFHRPGWDVPREPNVPGAGRPSAGPPPVPVQPAAPAPAPAPAAAPAPAPPPPVATTAPPGTSLNPTVQAQTEREKQKPKTPEEAQGDKLEQVGKSIGDLGKAMQGVKAPEPLKPPNIGAPSVRTPHPAGAPSVAQLGSLLGVGGGQVPASAMPILRLLGRA